MNIVEWLSNNWHIILLIVICLFVIFLIFAYPKKVKEWLIYAVSVSESNLGSGTGQLKLRKVYDMFISKYPIISTIIPFSIFSDWVDFALKFLKTQLENNDNVKKLVEEGNIN